MKTHILPLSLVALSLIGCNQSTEQNQEAKNAILSEMDSLEDQATKMMVDSVASPILDSLFNKIPEAGVKPIIEKHQNPWLGL